MGGAFLRRFSGTDDEVGRCWFCVGGGVGDGDGGRRGEEDSECGSKKDEARRKEGKAERKKEGGFFYLLALLFMYVTFLSG